MEVPPPAAHLPDLVAVRLGAAKGLLEWDDEDSNPIPERGGAPMRRFRVTLEGRKALRLSREALLKLWDGIEPELENA